MRIALAQLNTTVGDLAGNEAKILAAYRRGVEAGADLVIVPELAIVGYPPRDLLLKPSFVRAGLAALGRLAAQTGEVGLLVGFVGETRQRPGRGLTNSAALLAGGQIVATRDKTLLPTYDVFDEDRWFQPASGNTPIEFRGRKLGVTICEDVWNDEDFWPERRYRPNPAVDLAQAGADLLLNLSASPWHLGKERTRHAMLRSLALKTGRAEDTTEENLQARLRGVTLMAISNKFGSLLLTTGNKSELAVGYCTLYGDMCGGLAVISDVPKTMVYRLARWINRGREVIPTPSITKPPSAELRPNQTDQDSLPPYEVLDAILEAYVVQSRPAEEIIASGFAEADVRRVVRLIDGAEYKRRQAAPGLKITTKAFGVGRRIPIAQRWREI